MLFYIDMYSLEYSGILYACILSSSVWLSLLTSCSALNYANTPFIGAGRRPAPHPFLAIFPSPKAILFILILSALYRMRICYVL